MPELNSCGICVYPDYSDMSDIEKTQAYIEDAVKLGYTEVFSSLHLPESRVDNFLEAVSRLGCFVRKHGMEFSLDIAGKEMAQFLSDRKKKEQLLKIPVDWMRMDFGFDHAAICKIVSEIGLTGLMCNASVLSSDEAAHLVPMLRDRLGVSLRAHHNFYPRPETGLSRDFFCEKSRIYLQYSIPVTASVPSHAHPRLPVFEGLPTIERHRKLQSGQAAEDLKATGLVSSILIGDPFASQDELRDVAEICGRSPVRLRVTVEPDITKLERQILFGGVHHSRPDKAEFSIRSQSSREMATPGAKVPARDSAQRRRYDITIDNEKYCRYSGELQILTGDLPGDKRVNIAAHICAQDRGKVERILPGMDFELVNMEDLI